MKTINIYLSGPMYLGKDQATRWRDEVKHQFLVWQSRYGAHDLFRFDILDPCDRWYEKGPELEAAGSYVVQMDKMEIAKAHVVLVNATDPGWGTPMEQYIAFTTGKMVVAFSECEFPSIWAIAHSHRLFKSHNEAALFICGIANNLARVV